jgi:acyl transferase domain-containing protein/acyl carrier protein
MTHEMPNQNQDSPALEQGSKKEPIAIIGIGCRYPGGINNPEQFWSLLLNETHVVSEIPSDRIDVKAYYDPRPATPGKIMTRWGGFLENIDQMDASFFGIAPREAERLDPQQRLLLEVAWESLEDAGQIPEQLKGSQTGVFTGLWLNDFEARLFADPSQTDFYMTTGSGRYSASGRVSYFLGLQGPSITIDTACSSSLVAVHLACQSLWTGETSLALAGGANVILQPHITIAYSQSKMMAPDGRCKFGDAQADGYVRSEGAAMVVLKRLSQAIVDGDPIYAVIRGSAVNNDGQSSGFLATPGQQGQEEMLRTAYRSAGVNPRDVQYVEAHGTGTRTGDPVELGALGTVLGQDRPLHTPLLVGSVKTNLGHTESAAGIAGLIKVALSLKNGLIPPSLHLKELNPNIHWQEWKLTIPQVPMPWSGDQEKIAGVSAFGIAGTNAHIVLAEAPKTTERALNVQPGSTYLLPLSAQTPEALHTLASSYAALLNTSRVFSLSDLCYTAGCRRMHHAERLAVTGTTAQEMTDQLSAYLADETGTRGGKISGRPKVAFVFPGQGAQWLGMGRELLKQNSVFCEVLAQCDDAINRCADWSLLEQLSLEENSSAYRLNEISVIQPTLFAMEIALAAVWQSWGVEASAVIGHSMGEAAAAYVAGALSLDDAVHIICKRSQLMQRVSGKGAMAVIGLSFNEVEKLLHGYEGKLSVAVQNSPKSTVVSGDPDALELFMENLHTHEIFCRLIKVDVASHSPQMDRIRPELVESVNNIHPQATLIPFYSTVTQDICDGEFLNAEYWGRNLREPVRFSETVQRLLEDEHVIFIEMSPHPILLSSIQEICSAVEKTAYGFACLRRDQPELVTMLGELGSLYKLGYDIKWNSVFPARGETVPLPLYPWQRERYWFETKAFAKQMRPGAHPFLEKYIHLATGEHLWETAVSARLFPYLNDHQVRGSIVFPAAAYVELVFAAASEISGSRPYRVKGISFEKVFFLSNDEEKILQLILTIDSPESADFHVYSRNPSDVSPDSWSLHARGMIEFTQEIHSDTDIAWRDLQSQPMEMTADEFYDHTSERGLEYGSNFRSVVGITQQQAGILSKIKLSDDLISLIAKYLLHPVLLDACFQSLLAALPVSNQDTYLPTSVEMIEQYSATSFDHELWCYIIPKVGKDLVSGDIYLFDNNAQMILSARQLQLQRVEAGHKDVRGLLYEIQWQESPLPAAHAHGESKHWLIFADRQDTGERLAESLQHNHQTCTLVSAGKEYRSSQIDRYEIDPSRPAHFQQFLKEVGRPVHGIVHLWSLDQAEGLSITDSNVLGILYLTQAIVQLSATEPRLWLVTRGAQSVLTKPEPVSVSQAPVWGMGAVIANEFPALHCTRVDLSPVPMDNEIELLTNILQVQDEDQVALRNRQRYAARLKRVQALAGNDAKLVKRKVEARQSFQIQVTTPGILDSLSIKSVLRKSPKAGEVEIAVKATGLNFMNVMGAMGIYPGYPNGVGPLGIECSGVVVNVGEGVTDFRLGDEVAGIAFHSLASHVVTDARLIVKKPSFLSFEEAASIPIGYVTAYYALHHLGRLQKNERVLIHSASGGVGLAAIQLAKLVGAEIFVTAGSHEKREYLQTLGIRHIMDSRSLSFGDDVLKITHGEGVDVVLNSLAGNAIAKGLEALKPYGRFLEIGKRDIYQNSKIGLLPFQKNLSYFAIDLDKMSRERPDIVGGMLRELFEMMERGEIASLPLRSFPVSQVSDGFRMMAQAKHIGKIAITLEDSNASFEVPAETIPVNADGTYLITGGLGDLGLTFARWLAERGARHLVLLGRSVPSETAQRVIDELCASDVNVIAMQADVSDMNQLSEIFARIKQTFPSLKGIIHAAGLLSDGTIPQMDQERFMLAYAPKALGAWNLHTLTADQSLDFFILFSSAAAILGTPGQINYAAGNAFLDALSRFRRVQNLPALSIDWGPWSEIGLASAQENRGQRLALEGLMSITPIQGLEVMDHTTARQIVQVAVMSFSAERWCVSHPTSSAFMTDLLHLAADKIIEQKSHQNIRDVLLKTEPGKGRKALFETHVREQVAYVLRMPALRVPMDKPLKTIGLDSLMSLELRNRLEDTLDISIPAAAIWNHPTVVGLTTFLATKIDIPLEMTNPENEPPRNAIAQEKKPGEASTDIDNLSKTELDALLLQELNTMENLLRGMDNEQHA